LTPAYWAAFGNSGAALHYLHALVPGALEAKDQNGMTPAHAAAQYGSAAALECLNELVPGALEVKDEYDYTPAHHAALSDSWAAIQCIQKLVPGALETKDEFGQTPADIAEADGYTELAQYLQLASKCNDLMSAAMLRLPQRMERLLHDGADPTTQLVHQQDTHTALSLALNQPQYSCSMEMCPQTVELVRRSLVFSEEAHHLFPPGFRRAVRHVLGVKVALDRTQPEIAFSRMPAALWMVVLEKLDRNYAI